MYLKSLRLKTVSVAPKCFANLMYFHSIIILLLFSCRLSLVSHMSVLRDTLYIFLLLLYAIFREPYEIERKKKQNN